MATIVGESGTVEVARLRQALDDAGFPDGADRYRVRLAGPCPPWMSGLSGPAGQPAGDGRTIVLAEAAAGGGREAWRWLAAGAEDVIAWAGEESVEAVVARLVRWRAVDRVLESPTAAGLVVGSSPALRSALVELVELAVFGSGPILLTGETGTGKEVAARLVHAITRPERTGDLVVVDCTTIVPSLSGSELFGHERGAFTGADRARAGAFAAANGGTLFLDEIGELPLTLQAELLRVIQEGTFKRVGGDVWTQTSFRLVSATNRDLEQEQHAGRFRADLYHRIASGVVRLPPLQDRPDDVEPLFCHFLAEAAGEPLRVTGAVLTMLRERAFPGNLRELRQLAYAVAARHPGTGPVTPGDIPPRYRPECPPADGPEDVRSALVPGVRACLRDGMTLPDLKALVSDLAVDLALADCEGSARRAAAVLGVTDRAIQLRKQVPKPRVSSDQ